MNDMQIDNIIAIFMAYIFRNLWAIYLSEGINIFIVPDDEILPKNGFEIH